MKSLRKIVNYLLEIVYKETVKFTMNPYASFGKKAVSEKKNSDDIGRALDFTFEHMDQIQQIQRDFGRESKRQGFYNNF